MLPLSKRHGFLSSPPGIPHIVVVVDKMDLGGFSEDVYREIVRDQAEFAEKFTVKGLAFLSISAVCGDDVVRESDNTPCYEGATLLHDLGTVDLGANRNLVDFRFPVQYFVRLRQDFWDCARRGASGPVRPGEEVSILPPRKRRATADFPLSGDVEVVVDLLHRLDLPPWSQR